MFFDITPVRGAEHWLGASIFAMIMGTVAYVFLWSAAGRMLTTYSRSTTIPVEINAKGVIIGDDTFLWEDIQWIGGTKSFLPPGMKLRLGSCHIGYEIPLNRPLSAAEFRDLMTRIESAIFQQHPHVEVGRVGLLEAKAPPIPE
jgi:hypothetical protein